MSVFLPIEKTSKALSCRTVTLGGLDLRECKEQESVASCLNLDSSHPRFLRGHKRWQDCSISVAGAKLQLGMFSLGSDLYVVGHDGSYLALYLVKDGSYTLVHTFSESISTSEAERIPLSVVFCSPGFGNSERGSVYLYPFGYCITVGADGKPSAYSQRIEEIASLQIRHAVLYQNRIFATDGIRILASRENSPTDFSTYDDFDTRAPWQAKVYDDGCLALSLLGFACFQGKLYYFGKNCFGMVRGSGNPFYTQLTDTVGTLNIRSVCQYDENLYFLSEKGLMVFDGQKIRCISERLGMDRFADGVGGVWKGQYYLAIPAESVGTIYTYCPEKQSWGNILCYGNCMQFGASNGRFYMLCDFLGKKNVYRLSDTPNGWSAESAPIDLGGLQERHLVGVRMQTVLADGEKINCDLILTRSDGSKETIALFSDLVGKTSAIAKKILNAAYCVALSFSIRATGGAGVGKIELILEQSEVQI